MDLNDIDDSTLDDLADRLAERLDPGAYGDRVVLSRRQLVGVATGVLGTGTLLSLGVDPAAAQAAGSVGTSSDPVDVFAYDLDVANGVTSSLKMNGNDITGAGSVSTSSIDNSGSPISIGDVLDRDAGTSFDGVNVILSRASDDVNAGGQTATRRTDSVSTSATPIYQLDSPLDATTLLVTGDERGSSNRFSDVIHAFRSSLSVSVINSEELNTPSARSYSVNTNDDVELSMGSKTYDVAVFGLVARRDVNATN